MRSKSRILAAVAAVVLSATLAGVAHAGQASASIEQVRNGLGTATTTPTPTWVSGNAGGSNSHYLESHSIAYRTVMINLPTNGTVIELTLDYAAKKSGSYAIDYLTQYQRLLPHVTFAHTQPEVVDPLNGISGVGPVVTTAPIPLPTNNTMIDPDGADAAPAVPQPATSMSLLPDAERVMTLFGGTLIDVTYVTQGDMSLAASTSDTQVKVRFTANSSTAVLAWGGHIASRWEWGFNADGTPRSAGGISGSSYHMSLVGWSLGSLGSQDRSLSTDAVIAMPVCGIVNQGPFCANTTNTHTGPSGMTAYQWSLFSNTSGATIVGSDTSRTVTVNAGPNGGSYGILLVTTESGFTKQCQATVTVNAPITADAGPDQLLCSTSPQAQLAGAVSGGAGAWSGGAGTYNPNASTLNAIYTPTATEIAAGSVTLTLTASMAGGTCPPASDQVKLSFQKAATANAGADITVCASNPRAQLAGAVGGGASAGTWSGGAGTFTPNASALNATYDPTPAEIAAGGVTLTLTTTSTGGPCAVASDDVRINILPAASANAGADASVCASNPKVTLAGAVGGGASSGTWSGGAGTFSPSATALNATYTPTAAEIAAGGVTLTLTTNDPAGPCGPVSDAMRINISPAATANAGADAVVCASAPAVQLAGAVGGGATTGSWSGGAGTFSPSASALNATYTPTAAEIAAGSVTLTLATDPTTGPCGQASDQMVITIQPAAIAHAGADVTVCGSAPSVQLAGTVGGGASSGTWSGGAGTFSPSASTLNATYTPSAAEIAAGGVTLTLTTNDPAGPCGAASANMHITIAPAATANAGLDITVCSSSPAAQLAGVIGGGASSGTWSGGAGTFNPNASTLNATYTPTAAEIAAGAVTLTLTSAPMGGTCPQVSDQVKITILPAATVVAGADRTVCASNPSVQLAGVIGGGASSAMWSGGAGTFSPNASTLNATYTPSAAEIAAGSVTLTLTTNDPAGPCGAVSGAMHITIAPAATVNAGPDVAVCSSNAKVSLAGVIGGGATGGTWSGGAGTFNPNASTPNAVYTPSAAEIAAGSVTLTLTTNANGGTCPQVSDQMKITITPAATVNAGQDAIVCATSPNVTLAGAVGGGASSGTWSGGAGTFSPNASTLNATYTPSSAEIAAGSVTLTITTNDPVGPCDAVSDQIKITISPAVVVNAGPDQAVCASSPQVQLAGSVSGGATTGTWSGGAGTYSPSASTLNAKYTPSAAEIAAGTVTLTLTSGATGTPCPPMSDQMVITIGVAATVNAGPDQAMCASTNPIQLAGNIGGSATSATWSGGAGGAFSPNATTLNATYTPTVSDIAAGKVTLTLTTNDPAGPCGPVSDQMVITLDQPAVSVADRAICNGMGPLSLCANVTRGIAPYTYLWSNGATTSCISVADTGSYSVTITDAKGCQASGAGRFLWRDCTGLVAHTSTTCDQFLGGTAAALVQADINWGTQNNVISTISPGVFFYFSRVKAPSANFTIQIQQIITDTRFPYCAVMQNNQVTVYDANCGNVASVATVSGGQASVAVSGATPGQWYVVSVKYSLKSLVGTYMDPTMGCHYDFHTVVNGLVVDADPDGFWIGVPQQIAGNGGGVGGGGTPGTGGDGGGDVGGIIQPRGTGGSAPAPGGTGAPGDTTHTGGGGAGGGSTGGTGGTTVGTSGLPDDGTLRPHTSVGAEDATPLERPMPNPFTSGMHMAYSVSHDGDPVEINVYDVTGRRVKTLENGVVGLGRHQVAWDGRDQSGALVRRGMYFIHIRIGTEARQVRVTFVN